MLPLRGKILNVERKDDSMILKNNEIANLIVALGLGAKVSGDVCGAGSQRDSQWVAYFICITIGMVICTLQLHECKVNGQICNACPHLKHCRVRAWLACATTEWWC